MQLFIYITFEFCESHGWAGWWDPKDISLNQTSNLEQTEEVNHKEAANNRLYRKLLTVDCVKVINRRLLIICSLEVTLQLHFV